MISTSLLKSKKPQTKQKAKSSNSISCIVHSCVTPAVTFMIPYALLNGVSLSWCSLIGRLIKRHDLWLIKAEPIIKEIHFNLQGERRGEKKTGRRNLCWGHCWHAIICKAGTRGLLWGFTTTAHGASRARSCSKAPWKVHSPEPHSKPRAYFSAWAWQKPMSQLSSASIFDATYHFDGLCCN